MRERIARWQTQSGKHWVELYAETSNNRTGYGYQSPDACGFLGYISEDAAVSEMERKISYGMFQPGSRPVERVEIED